MSEGIHCSSCGYMHLTQAVDSDGHPTVCVPLGGMELRSVDPAKSLFEIICPLCGHGEPVTAEGRPVTPAGLEATWN